jgi:CRISPR-associated protein Csd1
MLDPTCTNNAYCLGRLFAVLEKLQTDAIGNPNATITDRFYGAASATPAAVFGTLLRKAQHHLSRVPYHNRTIEEVLGLLDPANAFPPTLDLAEQGLYALGYYHQRADLWKKKETPETSPVTDA